MKHTGLMLLAMAGALAAVPLIHAQEENTATLKVGDPAPAITSGEWIKGDAVTAFEPGTVYVVEFWATWCGPCRVSIPHLSDLQARLKDRGVVIIGQNCSEGDPDAVRAFVEKMGDKMAYRVALDDTRKEEQGSMYTAWMSAAGQDGIPAAFVVGKDGRIAWIGHPMNGLDRALDGILEGTFDAAEEGRQAEKLSSAQQALSQALEAGDFDAALKQVAALAELAPEEEDSLKMLRFQLLLAKPDYPAAYAEAATLIETFTDDAEALNELAWVIATGDGITERNLGLAEKAALRANVVSGGKEGAILDTVARVYFEKGMLDKAIIFQQQALEHATEEDRPIIAEALEKYRAAAKDTEATAPVVPAAP